MASAIRTPIRREALGRVFELLACAHQRLENRHTAKKRGRK